MPERSREISWCERKISCMSERSLCIAQPRSGRVRSPIFLSRDPGPRAGAGINRWRSGRRSQRPSMADLQELLRFVQAAVLRGLIGDELGHHCPVHGVVWHRRHWGGRHATLSQPAGWCQASVQTSTAGCTRGAWPRVGWDEDRSSLFLTGRRHPATEWLRVRGAITVEGIGTAVKDADTVRLLVPVGEHVGGCHDTVAQQLEGRPDALTRLRLKREGEACKALQWSYSDDTMYWMKIFSTLHYHLYIGNLQLHILQVSITLCYNIKNNNANAIFI